MKFPLNNSVTDTVIPSHDLLITTTAAVIVQITPLVDNDWWPFRFRFSYSSLSSIPGTFDRRSRRIFIAVIGRNSRRPSRRSRLSCVPRGARITMDTENDELLFCRFCLRHSQSSFPIFMASDPDLAKDVMNCLQIKVRLVDVVGHSCHLGFMLSLFLLCHVIVFCYACFPWR